MRWVIKNPRGADVARAYLEWGQPVPEGLKPPELDGLAAHYWSAYVDLSTERTQAGEIPFSTIKNYGEHYDYNVNILLDIIRHAEDVRRVTIEQVRPKTRKK